MLEPVLSKEKPYKFPEPPSGSWEGRGASWLAASLVSLSQTNSFPSPREHEGFRLPWPQGGTACEVYICPHFWLGADMRDFRPCCLEAFTEGEAQVPGAGWVPPGSLLSRRTFWGASLLPHLGVSLPHSETEQRGTRNSPMTGPCVQLGLTSPQGGHSQVPWTSLTGINGPASSVPGKKGGARTAGHQQGPRSCGNFSREISQACKKLDLICIFWLNHR